MPTTAAGTPGPRPSQVFRRALRPARLSCRSASTRVCMRTRRRAGSYEGRRAGAVRRSSAARAGCARREVAVRDRPATGRTGAGMDRPPGRCRVRRCDGDWFGGGGAAVLDGQPAAPVRRGPASHSAPARRTRRCANGGSTPPSVTSARGTFVCPARRPPAGHASENLGGRGGAPVLPSLPAP